MRLSYLVLLCLVFTRAFCDFYEEVDVTDSIYTVFLHDWPGRPQLNKTFYLEDHYSGFNVTHTITDINKNISFNLSKYQESSASDIFSQASVVKKLENIDIKYGVAIGALFQNSTFQIVQLANKTTLTIVDTFQFAGNGSLKGCSDFLNTNFDTIHMNCIDQNGNYTFLRINITSRAYNLSSVASYVPLSGTQTSFLAGYPADIGHNSIILRVVFTKEALGCSWLLEKWIFSSSLQNYIKLAAATQDDVKSETNFDFCLLNIFLISMETFLVLNQTRNLALFDWKGDIPSMMNSSDLGSATKISAASVFSYNNQSVVFSCSNNIVFYSVISTFPPCIEDATNYTLPANYLAINAILVGQKLVIEVYDQIEEKPSVIIYNFDPNPNSWIVNRVFYMNEVSQILGSNLFSLSATDASDDQILYLRTNLSQTWLAQIFNPIWTVTEAEYLNSSNYYQLDITSVHKEDSSVYEFFIPLFYYNSSYFVASKTTNSTAVSSLDLLYPMPFNLQGNLLGVSGPSLLYGMTGFPSLLADYALLGNTSDPAECLIETDSFGNIWKVSFLEDSFTLSHCYANDTTGNLTCDYEWIIEDFCDAQPYRLLVQASPLITIFFGFPGFGLGGIWVGLAKQNGLEWNITNYITTSEFNYSSSCIDVVIPTGNPNFLYCLAYDTSKESSAIIAYNLSSLLYNNFAKFPAIAIESSFLPTGSAFDMLFQIDAYQNLLLLTNHLNNIVSIYQTNFLIDGPQQPSTITLTSQVTIGKNIMAYEAWNNPFLIQKTGTLCVYFGTFGVLEEWNINTTALTLTFQRQTVLYGSSLSEVQGTFPSGRAAYSSSTGNLFLLAYNLDEGNQRIYVYNVHDVQTCNLDCSSRLPRGIIESSAIGLLMLGIQAASIQDVEADFLYIWSTNQGSIISYQKDSSRLLLSGMLAKTTEIQSLQTQVAIFSKFTTDLVQYVPLNIKVYQTITNITYVSNISASMKEIDIYEASNYSWYENTFFSGCILAPNISASNSSDISSGHIKLQGKLRTTNVVVIDYELRVDETYSEIIVGNVYLYAVGSSGIYIGEKSPFFLNDTAKFNLLQLDALQSIQNGGLIVNKNDDLAAFIEGYTSTIYIFNPKNLRIINRIKGYTSIKSGSITSKNTGVFFVSPHNQNDSCTDSAALLISNLSSIAPLVMITYKVLCQKLGITIHPNTTIAFDACAVDDGVSNTYSHVVFLMVSDPSTSSQNFYACQLDINSAFYLNEFKCIKIPFISLIWDYNASSIYFDWKSTKILYTNTTCIQRACSTKFIIILVNGNFNSYTFYVEMLLDLTVQTSKILAGFRTYLPSNHIELVGVSRQFAILKMASSYSTTKTYLPISGQHLLVYNLSTNQSTPSLPYPLYDAEFYSVMDYSNHTLGFDIYTNKLFLLSKTAASGTLTLEIKGIFEAYLLSINSSSNITSNDITISAVNFAGSQSLNFVLTKVNNTKKTMVLFYLFIAIIAFGVLCLAVYFIARKVSKRRENLEFNPDESSIHLLR